ncbi:MAG: hypothetical protein IPH07_32835 [Deltaproteobacteria bacterium]|nr:hypothetical protein [Deltaproteobacteria bacterium]MBK8234968.1 hypothetical protein [Deltaproteobacteria bacterium]MBK8716720.1 hypothetical protein [Deltaproteobacteria bacterium]MBP7285313.1 hypothetical protein [Nannocystaceae bacterium]
MHRAWCRVAGGVGSWVIAIAACSSPASPDGENTGAGTPTGGSSSSSESDGSPTTTAKDTSTDATQTGPATATDGAQDTVCDGGEGDWDLGPEGTSGGAEDTNAGMGDDIPIGATVFVVRTGGIPAGTLVELDELVVTSPVAVEDGEYLVFVQSPEGGENSAITVRSSAPLQVEIGDAVRVVGRVATKLSYEQIVLEGAVADVVVEGTATLPPPVTLPLSALLAPGDGPQPYESALVRIESATVTDPEVCSGEFALTTEVRVDDLFLGGNAPSPSVGATYSAIIGPLRFTEDAFDVAPRSLADLVP